MDGLNSRVEGREKTISEHQYRTIQLTQYNNKVKTDLKKI